MNLLVNKNRIILLAAVLMLTTFTFTGTGCRVFKHDKQSIADNKAKEADKKLDAEYEKAHKKHYTNQDKETKKMMKQSKKQALKYNESRKRKSFLGIRCK